MRMFWRRWMARSGDRAIDRSAPLRAPFYSPVPPPTGPQFARVGETFDGVLQEPGRRPFRSRVVAAQDIWLRSILAARSFIYIEEQYLISDCAAEAIRTVLPRLAHVTILIPPSGITDLPGRWQRRRAFIEHITRRNPHAGKLHVYTRTAGAPGSCHRDTGRHLYVHAKMAVIDDELMLVGSANMNNRGWETDSELVVAAFEDTRPGSQARPNGCAWRCGPITSARRRRGWPTRCARESSGIARPPARSAATTPGPDATQTAGNPSSTPRTGVRRIPAAPCSRPAREPVPI